MKLTEHFALEEFLISQTAARKGIDNSPTPEHLENLRRVADVLEKIRERFNSVIRISSGYRSARLNAAVPGSSKTSAHCKGLAVDFIIPGIPNIDVCRWIAANLQQLQIDQVIYEFGPTGWVHVGLADNPRHQQLTAVKGAHGTEYLPGIVEV